MNIAFSKTVACVLVVGGACLLPQLTMAKDDASFRLPSSSPMYMPPTGRPSYEERYKAGAPLYQKDANGQYVPENLSPLPLPDNQSPKSGKAIRYAANDRFGLADYNIDGFLSPREAARYPKLQKNFQQIDRDRDGYISYREVLAWPSQW